MDWQGRLCRLALLIAALGGTGVRAAWGQFASRPACTLTGIWRPACMAAGDLNRDGLADLVVSSWPRRADDPAKFDPSRGRVLVFYQKNGGFQPPADKTIPVAGPTSLLVGDFDRDGADDLAVAGSGQWLHLFLGKDGLARDYANWNCNQYCWGPVQAGRLTAGGTADFLIGPVWRKWMGGKRYGRGYFYAPAGKDANGSSLLADLNYDGWQDAVFLTHHASGTVRIYYGPFLLRNVKTDDVMARTSLAAPAAVQALALADVSGDGRLDILAAASPRARPGRRKVFLFFQNAPIGFDDGVGPSAAIAGLAGRVVAADVNRDGLADIVAAGAGAQRGKVCVFLQRRGRPFPRSAAQADQALDAGGPVLDLLLADVNRDGRPDLLVAAERPQQPGYVRLFLNQTQRR